jgi:hypothetical protein
MGGIDGSQEANDLDARIISQHVQGPGAVFAGTPGKEHTVRHHPDTSRDSFMR